MSAARRFPPPSLATPSQVHDGRERFAIALARALHGCGVTSVRLERSLDRIGDRLGLQIDCFSAPTSLQISVDGERFRMFRLEPSEFRLAKLVVLNEVAQDVGAGDVDIFEGLRRLEDIEAQEDADQPALMTAAFALTSASVVPFFGGNLWDVFASGILGGLVGLLLRVGRRRPALGRLADGSSALLVALLASLLSLFVPIEAPLVALAALIVLVPGLTLTLALAELAERHLSSGSARLAGATMSFLQLGVGAALGFRIGEAVTRPLSELLASIGGPGFVHALDVIPEFPLPPAALPLGLAIAPPMIAILFHARPADWLLISLSCWAGYLGTLLGTQLLDAELGVFFGALAVGLLGKTQSIIRRVPATVTIVPGILLLVPGSMGFGSFQALLAEQTTEGVSAAFSMFLVASSLVAGLLVAHALTAPGPRRGSGLDESIETCAAN